MVKRYRGCGTIIRETLAAWFIKEHAGCGCNEICSRMDTEGADVVEQKLQQYKEDMKISIANWRKENSFPILQPPDWTIELLIKYGIEQSRQEEAEYRSLRL